MHPELLGAGLRGLDAGGANVRLPLRRRNPLRRALLARALGKTLTHQIETIKCTYVFKIVPSSTSITPSFRTRIHTNETAGLRQSFFQISGLYFVIAAIGEMRVNREDIVGTHSEEVKDKF